MHPIRHGIRFFGLAVSYRQTHLYLYTTAGLCHPPIRKSVVLTIRVVYIIIVGDPCESACTVAFSEVQMSDRGAGRANIVSCAVDSTRVLGVSAKTPNCPCHRYMTGDTSSGGCSSAGLHCLARVAVAPSACNIDFASSFQ